MASSEQPPQCPPRPARPSLSVPTTSETRHRHRLLLEEDQEAGEYQIRRLGGTSTASPVSLNSWNPIHSVPRTLIDAEGLESANDSVSETKGTKPQLRGGIARFSAWIKRSGKGLVVRLRRQDNKASAAWTDYHFVTHSNVAELASSPIVELAGLERSSTKFVDTPVELSDTSQSLHNELPGSEVSTELPTIHGWSELEVTEPRIAVSVGTQVPCSTSTISRPLQDSGPTRTFSFASGFQDAEALSPTGTTRSTFSTADTAVASVLDCTPGEEDMLGSGLSQPLVRGLTIAGSVRYRCDSHPDFEPASPVEVVRLIRKACGKGLRAMPRTKQPAGGRKLCVAHEADDDADYRPKLPLQAAGHTNDTSILSKREDSLDEVRERPTLWPGIPVQAQYEVVSSKTTYQQDLHVSKASTETHTFTTQLLGLVYPPTEKLEEVKMLLKKSRLYTPTGIEQRLPLRESTSTAGQVKRDILPEAMEVQPARPCPLPSPPEIESLDCPPALIGANNDAVVPIMNKSTTAVVQGRHDAASPISPLTLREKLQNGNSMVSQFVPVTPLTPFRISDIHADESLDRQAQLHAEVNTAGSNKGANGAGDDPPYHQQEINSDESSRDEAPEGVRSRPQVLPGLPARNDVDAPEFGEAEVKWFADCVDHQRSPAPVEAQLIAPLEFLPDEKMVAKYKNTRFRTGLQVDTNFTNRPTVSTISEEHFEEGGSPREMLLRTGRAEPTSRGVMQDASSLMVSGLAEIMLRSTLWLQRHAGKEPAIPEGHVRVRWTCNCGEQLYDDFVELREGAASMLEAVLNRERPHPYQTPGSGSRGSHSSFQQTPGSSHPSSSATSWSSRSATYGPSSGYPYKATPTRSSSNAQMFPMPQPQFLLTCVNEARNTPKLTQIPLHQRQVHTDTDLANALRDHYASVNRHWYRALRLRGLTSIEFVQFYAHRNRFTDIRKCPDVPPSTAHDYDFTPSDLLPPVGGRYLLHLFQHPHEYEDEVVAYLNIPKKLERLQHGIGWGITLTEGFLPERIWLFVCSSCVLFGCVFAVVWAVKEHDLQGAFAVASFLTTLGGMALGFVQACLG
ncbi:hypothetical protein LTR85_003805 [Meristemomyces frigidus]|nr:hypothetical protein LTR85_003805 [Meristemomyces frigidus]